MCIFCVGGVCDLDSGGGRGVGGGWRLSLVKLISDSSRYRSAQFRDSSTEMGGAKWMGILVKMLGGVGGLRWRGFGRSDEHRMYRTEVKIRIIFGTQLS